jgi:predicted  nucleic acid-binding Zn-ribbon protein
VTDAVDLEHLLAVQDRDTTITQLEHRRAALPETTGLRAVEAQLAELEVARTDAATRRAALAAAQKELEAQIAVITERRAGIEQRMYAATGSSARDLQAMNDEVTHLTDRRAELEELELVSMLEQDPIDAELGALDERAAPLLTQADEIRAALVHQQEEIDAELAAAGSARAADAALLPPALVDRYETLRARLKGTGAARLIKNRCDGCHLELSSGEVERIRALPPGEAATCEQCGRILVPV